jgi:hypothetical protein
LLRAIGLWRSRWLLLPLAGERAAYGWADTIQLYRQWRTRYRTVYLPHSPATCYHFFTKPSPHPNRKVVTLY